MTDRTIPYKIYLDENEIIKSVIDYNFIFHPDMK